MKENEERKLAFAEDEKETAAIMKEGETPDEEMIALPKSIGRELLPETGAIETAERRLETLKKIRIISLKTTSENDWMDMRGKPYLTDDGSKAIANVWGIQIFGLRLWKEISKDEEGEYYIWTASGKAFSRSLNRYYEDIGTCSQRDLFFGVTDGKFRPLKEIDETSVKKAAVTNLHARLIKGVAGIKNISYDDLKAAGLNIERIQKVEFKNGAKKIEKTLSADSLKKKEEINSFLTRLAGTDKAIRAAFLKDASIFISQDGKEIFVDDIDKLTSDKWISKVYGNLKHAWEKHEGAMNGKPAPAVKK